MMEIKEGFGLCFTSFFIKSRKEMVLIRMQIYSGSKDNIWGADLADMQLISKFSKGFRFLLCATDIFRKYLWIVP